MGQIKVIMTEANNTRWWDVVEENHTYKIPGVETFKRLGVFSTWEQVNDFITLRRMEPFKEYAVDTAPKELR